MSPLSILVTSIFILTIGHVAHAQEANESVLAYRYGLGYSLVENTNIIDKPLRTRSGIPFKKIGPYPTDCFKGNGIDGFTEKGTLDSQKKLRYIINKLGLEGSQTSYLCGSTKVLIKPILEATTDRKTWEIFDTASKGFYSDRLFTTAKSVQEELKRDGRLEHDTKNSVIKYYPEGEDKPTAVMGIYKDQFVSSFKVKSDHALDELISLAKKEGWELTPVPGKDSIIASMYEITPINIIHKLELLTINTFIARSALDAAELESGFIDKHGEDWLEEIARKVLK